MIRDEVLLITTPEEAESELVTKVYPVGDLVLPITSGMGMGGGMGGGFFAVEDDLTPGAKKAAAITGRRM
jgi:hypothetical protein